MSKKEIWVIGHKSPDTDCVTSAIVYADFKNKTNEDENVVFIPKVTGEINKETKFVLDHFGIEVPEIATDLTGKAVILVDHEEEAQAADNLSQAELIEIVDHHRLGGLCTPSPVSVRVCPVGATGSVINTMYNECKMVPDAKMAGLMLSAICSDTLLFRSPTCTPCDKIAVEKLAVIAGIDNVEAYAKEMFKAGSDIGDKTPEELFFMDFKKFEIGDKVIGVGQVSTIDSDAIGSLHEKISGIIDRMIEENGLNMAFFMLTDIMEEATTLVCAGEGGLEMIKKAYNVDSEGDAVYLPGVVSRKKQIIPTVTEALQ